MKSIKSSEDIYLEIDKTLDQLIQNAIALKSIPLHPDYQQEIDALQKMQESLLSHLMHMDELLDEEKKVNISSETFPDLEEKFSTFGKLSEKLLAKMSKRSQRTPHKKKQKKPLFRKKKFLSTTCH